MYNEDIAVCWGVSAVCGVGLTLSTEGLIYESLWIISAAVCGLHPPMLYGMDCFQRAAFQEQDYFIKETKQDCQICLLCHKVYLC